MKKRLLLLMCAVIGSLVLLPAFAQDTSSVINANNRFAFELYSRYKLQDGNIFFSPYSISSALAMAYEGARGKTAAEMQAVFHFPANESLRKGSYREINNRYNREGKKYILRVANSLWAQKDYPFMDSYLATIRDFYGGEATNLDFLKQPEESRVEINSWVAQKTNDRITGLIPPGGVDQWTRLVLTNAIYFKGSWRTPFDKDFTRDADFRTGPGTAVKAPTMHETLHAFYGETEKLQILELPYEEDLSMLVLLPKDDHPNAAEAFLSAEMLTGLKSAMTLAEVDVSLPRFKFATGDELSNDLSAMGMKTAFMPGEDFFGQADFSGMTGNKTLNIKAVFHKAFVEVNEEGTEAAAATAVTIQAGAAVRPEPKVFRADHPFIFLIQDTASGTILFIGRMMDPAG
jgi:serpin B